jgi:hypothetical protein
LPKKRLIILRDGYRICENCKEKQKWLPGYGGSETGYWMIIYELIYYIQKRTKPHYIDT